METHPSILVWEIPWTEEPGGLQCMGSQSQTHLSHQATAAAASLLALAGGRPVCGQLAASSLVTGLWA